MCAHINPYFTAHKPCESEWATNMVQGMGAWLLSSSVNPVCSAPAGSWFFFFSIFFVSVGPRLPHWGGDSWAATVGGHPVRQKPSRRLPGCIEHSWRRNIWKKFMSAALTQPCRLGLVLPDLTASTLFTRCGSLTLFVKGSFSRACRFSLVNHWLSLQHCRRYSPLVRYFSDFTPCPSPQPGHFISFDPSILGPNTAALLATFGLQAKLIQI